MYWTCVSAHRQPRLNLGVPLVMLISISWRVLNLTSTQGHACLLTVERHHRIRPQMSLLTVPGYTCILETALYADAVVPWPHPPRGSMPLQCPPHTSHIPLLGPANHDFMGHYVFMCFAPSFLLSPDADLLIKTVPVCTPRSQQRGHRGPRRPTGAERLSHRGQAIPRLQYATRGRA